MAQAKCLITDFTYASNHQLDNKAIAVCTGLVAHAADFPAPPVSVVALKALLINYTSAMVAYKRGGLDQRAHFLNTKVALLQALTENANYVNTIANGSAQLIVAAGYVSSKTARVHLAAPTMPEGITVKYGNGSGQLIIDCQPMRGAQYYGLIVAEGQPFTDYTFSKGVLTLTQLNQPIRHVLTKARKKTLQGFTPAVTYYFYMYCGNTTGVSSLSDAIKIMAV